MGADDDQAFLPREQPVQHRAPLAKIHQPLQLLGRQVEKMKKIDEVLGEVQEILPCQHPQRPPRQVDPLVAKNLAQVANHAFPPAAIKQHVQVCQSPGKPVRHAARETTPNELGNFQ